MRRRQAQVPGGAGPPQHQAGGRGGPAAAPDKKPPNKLYVANGSAHCTKAYAFINQVYTGEGDAKVTKKKAFSEVVEVINITKRPDRKPATLRGVPCFLEFSSKTGQYRPHYGTAAINAMAYLGRVLPADLATAADVTSPSGYSKGAGFAIDDTYEYDDTTPEEAEAAPRRAADIESFQAARAQRDQTVQARFSGGAPSVDFTEREDASSVRGMTMEQLQAARARPPGAAQM